MRGGRLWAAVRGWTAYGVLRVALGCILLTAAGLKAHQVATDPLVFLGGGWLESRPVVALAIGFEVFLGLWLLSGIYARAGWLMSLVTFNVFAAVSLSKALAGSATCGCFGRLEVNPWWTFSFDATAVVSLLRFWPKGGWEFTSVRSFCLLRRASVGVAVVVLLSAVFTAQLWQRKDDRIVVSSAQNNTEIRGTNARRRVVFEHDFGVLAPKVERRHSFTVANATDIDWKIKRMEVPCACTIARITNTIIKAGSAETVELTYRSGTASADERRTVSLVFEEDDAPIVQLALRAQVRTPLALSRDRVTFNSLGQGCRATEVVYVRNYSSTDWTALSLNSSVPWLRLSCRLLDSRSGGLGEPRQEWLCIAMVDTAGLRPGLHRGAVDIDASGLGRRTIVAEVAVDPPVVAVPSELFFGRTRIGVPRAATTTLLFGSTRPQIEPKDFIVRHSLGADLVVRLSEESTSQWQVEATFTPSRVGLVEGVIRIALPHTGLSDLEIPLRASVGEEKE